MLPRDTELLQRHEQQEKLDAVVAEKEKQQAARVRDARFVADINTSRANAELQRGTPMSTAVLERKLKKLNPNLQFEMVDGNPTKKRVIIPFDGKRCMVCLCEYPMMPEFSVMQEVEEEVIETGTVYYKPLDREVAHLDRKDITPSNPMPWLKKVKRPGRELTRGWRTVLLMLLHFGLISLEATEREFGIADRASWQHHTGKAQNDIVF